MKLIDIFKFFHHIYRQLILKDKIVFWLALSSSFIAAILPSVVLYFSALIIARLANNNFNQLYIFVILFVVFNIFASSASTISNFITDSINDLVWKITKKNILSSISMPYDISLFEDSKTRKLLTLSLLFGDDIHDSIYSLIAVLFGLIGVIPIAILMGLSVWWIPIFVIISFIPFIYFSSQFERQSWDVKEEHEDEFSRMRIYERILTQPEFSKEIRLFKMQRNLITKWLRNYDQFYSKAQKLRVKNSSRIIVVSILSALLLLIPIIYIVNYYIKGMVGIETVSLILGGLYGLKEAISSIVYNYSDALRVSYQIGPYLELTNREIDKDPLIKHAELKDSDLIAIRNLQFSYEQSGKKVLNNLNFNIKRNNSIAIVGDNGSGKSTLVKLLCGFYSQFDGNILWNSNNKKPKIFAMFQDFSKFPLPISDILLVAGGNQNYSKEKLEEVGLDFLADNLNETLSIEMGGRDLSIGQWQKLSLARLLTHADEADLLIFDEPNSALDPESESQIIDIILNLSKTKTSIIISHRMAVAKFVDTIMVLDDGKIVESGTHDALMNNREKYYKMFQAQAKFYS